MSTNEDLKQVDMQVEKHQTVDEVVLSHVLDNYIEDMYSIYKCVKSRLKSIIIEDIKYKTDELRKLKEYLKILEPYNEGKEELTEKAITSLYELNRIAYKSIPIFNEIIIKSLYLNLFSVFDEFMGDFLKAIFILKPELIKGSEKQITVTDIFECTSIYELKSKIIEKEIDAIRRESYVEQFSILEKRFGMSLKKFDNWNEFVEITQRRNIIMHCGGIASEQYIAVCKEQQCNNRAKKGDMLSVDTEYLTKAIRILLEVGIKIFHVTWRKLKLQDIGEEESNLNSVIFNLLIEEEYDLAIEIGKFAIGFNMFSSKEIELFLLINLCIAYKSVGDLKSVEEYIQRYDWTAFNKELNLAKNILLNNTANIYNELIAIGDKSDYFGKNAYATFPIFKFVLENENFKKGFYEVFGINLSEYISEVVNHVIDIEEIDIEHESLFDEVITEVAIADKVFAGEVTEIETVKTEIH